MRPFAVRCGRIIELVKESKSMHYIEAKTILSPQGGFNLYRGCTHGCIYCDSRSACYRIDHAFEDVAVKRNAPELLDAALRARKKPCMLATGSMCDPYLPREKELRLTRRCLEILLNRGFGVSVLTKSDLILRDLPLLQEINRQTKAVAQMTLTTWDETLCRIIEPNVCTTRRRVDALRALAGAGVPTAVWLCPLLPWLNDSEENLRQILDACFDAGVRAIVHFGMGLTLREGDREYFYRRLDEHFPGLKEKYIRRYGNAYEIPCENAAALEEIFHTECERHGVMHRQDEIFARLHELPSRQTTLWDEMTTR